MVILASPKTLGHSPKARLVVTMIEVLLVEAADQMEQQLAAGLGEGQIAEFVEHDEVHAGEIIGHASLAAGAGLGLEPVDEVDDVEEAAAGAVADAGPGDGDGEMASCRCRCRRPARRCADAARKSPPARSRTRVSLIGVPSKSKSSMSLASGSLAMVIWYLIERACFSAISAVSRSPTTRCGSCWRLTAVVMISS